MKQSIVIIGLALAAGATALLAGDAVVPRGSAAVSFRSVVTANGPVLYPYSIAAGDLTHSGIPDLAVVGVETPALLHALGKDNGRFGPWSNTGNAGDAPDFVIFADVDLDGNLDAVSADGDEPFVTVAFGDGKGNFNRGIQPLTGRGYDTQEVAVADLNGDRIPDLVGTSLGFAGNPGNIFILLGKGNRTFAKAVNIGSGGHSPNGIAVGDLNHDGIPDLVVANSLSNAEYGNVAVLLGKGDGTFEKPVRYQAGVSPWQVVLGDFNGDGKLDLAVLPIGGEDKIYVLLGKGDGTFGEAKAYRSGMFPESIAVADFNGDGILDLAIANSTNPKPCHVSILLGNGDGTFQPPIAFPVGISPASLITADFNHDGKPDLATLTGPSGITVLLNTTPFPTPSHPH